MIRRVLALAALLTACSAGGSPPPDPGPGVVAPSLEVLRAKGDGPALPAPGDTLWVRLGWHITSGTPDSVIVTVTTGPPVGTIRKAYPPAVTRDSIRFIPAPAINDGQTVTFTACFQTKKLTILGPCSTLSRNYTRPVDPGTVVGDSILIGVLMLPDTVTVRASTMITFVVWDRWGFLRWDTLRPAHRAHAVLVRRGPGAGDAGGVGAAPGLERGHPGGYLADPGPRPERARRLPSVREQRLLDHPALAAGRSTRPPDGGRALGELLTV